LYSRFPLTVWFHEVLAKQMEAPSHVFRILRTLSNSKYSIHDLSRFTGEGVENIARFNMPLERHPHCTLSAKDRRGVTTGSSLFPKDLHTRNLCRIWRVSIPEGILNRSNP
jgi:hypothetical protein